MHTLKVMAAEQGLDECTEEEINFNFFKPQGMGLQIHISIKI